jgi:hypothetical protein
MMDDFHSKRFVELDESGEYGKISNSILVNLASVLNQINEKD